MPESEACENTPSADAAGSDAQRDFVYVCVVWQTLITLRRLGSLLFELPSLQLCGARRHQRMAQPHEAGFWPPLEMHLRVFEV